MIRLSGNLEIREFESWHAKIIFLADQQKAELSEIEEKMIDIYSSKGSIARTLMKNEAVPLACGGIINLNYRRGEAWVLTSRGSGLYPKQLWQAIKETIPELASAGNFRRVQATCFDRSREKMFRLLGFERETRDDRMMECFGMFGEPADLYARIFQ